MKLGQLIATPFPLFKGTDLFLNHAYHFHGTRFSRFIDNVNLNDEVFCIINTFPRDILFFLAIFFAQDIVVSFPFLLRRFFDNTLFVILHDVIFRKFSNRIAYPFISKEWSTQRGIYSESEHIWLVLSGANPCIYSY